MNAADEMPATRRALTEAERDSALRMVADLSSPDFEVREAATAGLVALGPRVRPMLEDARERGSAEGRIRLQGVLAELAAAEEEEVRVNASATITLEATDQTLAEVLEVVAKLSGARFPDTPGVDLSQKLSIKLEDAPFFEALDRIALAVRMAWQQDTMPGSIRFQSGVAPTDVKCYSGPYRVALTRVSYNSNLSLATGGEHYEQGFLQGQFDVDPNNDAVGVWLPPETLEIVDDQGRSLKSEQAAAGGSFNPAHGRKTYHFSLPYVAPAKDAKRIATLRGRFKLAIPKRVLKLALPVASAGPGAEAGVEGTNARLVSVQTQGTQTVVVIELTRRLVLADDRMRTQVAEQRFEVHTRDGSVLRPVQPPTRSAAADKEVFTCVFGDLRSDSIETVVVNSLAALTHRYVDFEFKDLPLP